MKITINKIPPTINKYIGRTNIWQYQKDKKEMHEIIKQVWEQIKNHDISWTKCKIKITYYFKDKRRHDPSNYDKMLLDGLVYAGVIVDDSYEVIREFTTIGKYDKYNPRTEIEILEVKDETI
mgnify:CR=1 FL=1